MATVKAATIVQNPLTGEAVGLRAGDEIPDWAADQITNPDLINGDKPAPKRTAHK
ncbi:hypothetical protein GCM10010401_07350 [Rarobacter faecitabidus]|uniref:Uncharacterized protein n=1 Tax=Rarobacter faecitabidus TaxID=13243 RepID=A0A542Z8M4_RARFA|nr:hypothetical protein [Rarobacter faecitabidus]TQL56540.1 hypothetical protein FB461_2429 [Rarobacter faecitabidus]